MAGAAVETPPRCAGHLASRIGRMKVERKNDVGQMGKSGRSPFFDERLSTSVKKAIEREDFETLAGGFRILANAARLKIIFALGEGALCVRDIAVVIELGIPATSQHLKLLRFGNIVRSRPDGKKVLYSLISRNTRDAILRDGQIVSGGIKGDRSTHPA